MLESGKGDMDRDGKRVDMRVRRYAAGSKGFHSYGAWRGGQGEDLVLSHRSTYQRDVSRLLNLLEPNISLHVGRWNVCALRLASRAAPVTFFVHFSTRSICITHIVHRLLCPGLNTLQMERGITALQIAVNTICMVII